MSCKKETSPTVKVTPRFSPAAKPAAVLSTPSMPLAPLLAPTGTPTPSSNPPWVLLSAEEGGGYEVLALDPEYCRRQVAYISMSLIGMLFPMNKPFPTRREPSQSVRFVCLRHALAYAWQSLKKENSIDGELSSDARSYHGGVMSEYSFQQRNVQQAPEPT